MAGMVKAAMLKTSGDDVPIHRRAVAERPVTYEAATRRLAALTMSDEKKATVSRESRGDCGICGREVIAEIGGDRTKGHKRLRYNRESGSVHFHTECVADLCDQRERALSSKGICGICRQIVSEKEDRVKTSFVGAGGASLYVHPECARKLLLELVGVEGKG